MRASKPLQAFPSGDPWHGGEPGMTLRDWFAGQALAGAMSAHGSYGIGNGPGEVADRAYQLADAMLAARKVRRHE